MKEDKVGIPGGKIKSACCHAEVKTYLDDMKNYGKLDPHLLRTNFFICKKCGKACDIVIDIEDKVDDE